MTAVELALDWVPNTNHTGIYWALANGYYEAAGVDVTVRLPAADDYETTPAKRVATGASTVGIAPPRASSAIRLTPITRRWLRSPRSVSATPARLPRRLPPGLTARQS